MNTRLSVVLLMAVLSILTLARAEHVNSSSTLAAALPNSEVADRFFSVNSWQAEQEISKKYQDLSALPLKDRKSIFRRSTPAEKSGYWRTHLSAYLVNHPDLNEWQQKIVLDAMLLLTPAYFAVPSESPEWKTKVDQPSRSLESQIDVAFSREDAAKIFATLGADSQAAKLGPTAAGIASRKSINYEPPISDTLPYHQWTNSRFSIQDLELDQNATCGCNLDQDFCWGWKYCSANACAASQGGCGLGWQFPCNGVCR